MDNLEKYIRKHSPNWDDKKAPVSAWSKIESQLDSQKSTSSSSLWKYFLGASIVIITLVALVYVQKPAEPLPQNESIQFAEIQSFQETEQYFESAIFASYKELSEIHHDPDLERDLADLDSEEVKLREEYKNAQGEYKEYILRALIDVHRTKLALLQSVLIQITTTEKYADNVL